MQTHIPNKYMNTWETSILDKKEFYSRLNMEDITDADYQPQKSMEALRKSKL